ncbi:MAG: tandem-95 repeat protein [Oscillatoriales cyanobacterium RM2_1_1]|nr:tandem-95 repeat protein [Oscillatoriales cyanobacterium RM2_1_1]
MISNPSQFDRDVWSNSPSGYGLSSQQPKQMFSGVPVTIVIVDSAVKDRLNLINGIVPGVEVFVLGSQQDGVAQITQVLGQFSQVAALHIISHGSPGCLYLGRSTLSLDNLANYTTQLKSWSVSELLLYGCNVGVGDAGTEFIEKLHYLTGAEIAASKSLTGCAALGGNWDLDVRTGAIRASLALEAEFRKTYNHVLATLSFNEFDWLSGNLTFSETNVAGTGIAADFAINDPNGIIAINTFVDDPENPDPDGRDPFVPGLDVGDQTAFSGGLTAGQESLFVNIDPVNRGDAVTITLDFTQPLFGVNFFLIDIDDSRDWQDQIIVGGNNGGGTLVRPTVTSLNTNPSHDIVNNANTVTITGQRNIDSAATSNQGTALVQFNEPITQVTITYEDGPNASLNPGPHGVGLFGVISFTSISIDDVTVNKANGTATFTVTSSAPAGPGGINFDFATTDGTAFAPGDYTTTTGSGTISAGETTTTITVPIVSDLVAEPSETFNVVLSNVTGAAVTDDTGVGTIVDTAPANQPPVAIDDAATTAFNTAVVLPNITGNDTDADGTVQPGTVDLDPTTPGLQNRFTVAGEGSFTAAINGDVTFTPVAGFTGISTIPYTVQDDDGAVSNSANISVTVNPAGNQPPVANDDAATTAFDTAVVLPNITGNDTDADGTVQPATVDLDPTTPGLQNTFTVAGEGSFTAAVNGDVTFTPVAGFTGISTIPYTVQDNDGAVSNQADINVTVAGPINQPPVADDETVTTPLNTLIAIDVLDGDTDPENDPLTITSVSNPANGTAVVNNNGTPTDPSDDFVDYTPNPDFVGQDSFTYAVDDGNGGTATATVDVSVNAPGNTPPDAVDDDPLDLTQDTDLPITPAQLLANDTDPNRDPLTIISVQDPQNGTVVRDPATGNITFTPTPGYTGPASFTYTVDDGNGGTDTATVTLTVNPAPNQSPVADDDAVNTPFNTPIAIDVLEGDTDPESDSLTITSVSNPANGTAVVNNNGTPTDPGDDFVDYTPNPDFVGQDSFTYTVDDGNGGTATATVDVSVNAPGNTPPDAVDDDPLDLTQDTDLPITPAQLLANDTDPNRDPLTIISVQDPQNGTVVRDPATGNITFTPTPGYTGPASFTYTVDDGNGGTDTATVTLNVTPSSNQPPVAVDDSEITEFDTIVTFNIIGNDTDDGTVQPDTIDLDPTTPGRQITLNIPVEGSFTVADNGDVTYTPVAGFTGTSTISYTVQDNDGAVSDPANISVTVNGPNILPEAVDFLINIPTGNTDPIDLTGPTRQLRGTDADGTTQSVTIETLPDPVDGSLLFQGNPVTVGQTFNLTEVGSLQFQPTDEFNGGVFTYVVTDNDGDNSAPATVTLNAAPIATPETGTTPFNTLTTLNLADNVSDPDGTVNLGTIDLDPTTPEREIGRDVAGGRFEVDDAGIITFIPLPGFQGIATLDYTVEDNFGNLSNPAQVAVTVSGPIIPPTHPDPNPNPNTSTKPVPHRRQSGSEHWQYR